MAKKPTQSFNTPAKSPVIGSSPVRNSPVPRAAAPGKKDITREQIALRAYMIFKSGTGGSEVDNWLRAERELRA